MNRNLIRAALDEQAGSNVPPNPDLWPHISRQAQQEVHQPQRQGERLRLPFSPLPLALGGALTIVLVALWAISTLIPAPSPPPAVVISAEEIFARAAQVVQQDPGADLRSFRGVYVSRFRNDPNGPFSVRRQGTWFLAPDKYAQVETTRYFDGNEFTWSYGTDGVAAYQLAPGLDYLQLVDLETFIMRDPNAATLKVRPFSPTDLATVMERVRMKLPPARDPRSDPRPPYAYEVKLVGEDQILGRAAHVLELSLVPGASLQSPDSQIPEKMKMWIDKDLYAVLRLEGWGPDGAVLRSEAYESFEVNGSVQFDPLATLAPPGTDIVDTRPISDTGTLDGLWKDEAQRAQYSVFRPSGAPEGLQEGRPFYDERRQVISQQYLGEALVKVQGVIDMNDPGKPPAEPQVKLIMRPKLQITQGPATAIDHIRGEGTPVQIGNLKGTFYSHNGTSTLIFDRDGTRIKLHAPMVLGENSTFTQEQLVSIAETLEVVGKK